jgi:hypothetical protein
VTSIERTAYPRFKRLPSVRELHVFYTSQPDEVAWARGVAKCFGRLGYFPALADVAVFVLTLAVPRGGNRASDWQLPASRERKHP